MLTPPALPLDRNTARASAVGLLVMGLFWVSPSAGAATDGDVQSALATFNQHAHYKIPTLTASQRKRLLAGEVVKILDDAPDGSGSRRAVGLMVTDVARDAMWVACQDLHFVQSNVVHEYRLSRSGPDKSRWYGLVDLPRPFSDRHYVVDVWNNHALAAQSGNVAWEHPWSLVPGAVDQAKAAVEAGKVRKTDLSMWEDAVETPTNMGAWVAIALPDGSSVFGYHAATRVGGNIPEGLMLQYVKSTLDSTLKGIEARARTEIQGHYDASHNGDVIGGDGKAMPRFGG